jgi:membrane-associated protease RseP (regulator of RpoE activity)
MLTLIGIVLFVFLLMMSVAIHEFGHLLTAKAYGMKATEYFVGFGPKIWSFRRGETEYGLKGIPAGGYVKIVGMSDLETVPEADAPRAFYRYSAPKRLVVLSAGSISHMIIGFVLFVVVLCGFGIPTLSTAIGNVEPCIPAAGATAPCGPADPASPAKAAGLQAGDKVLAVDGKPIKEWEDATRAIRAHGPGPLPITVQRGGHTLTVTPDLVARTRPDLDDPSKDVQVGVLGVEPQQHQQHDGLIAGSHRSITLIGETIKASVAALWHIPEKVPNLISAIGGGQRDKEGLVGVVGAARISGETFSVHHASFSDRMSSVLLNVAGLNIFIGLFNALPLLPLDGGHMAVVGYESTRRRFYRRLGRADPGRVDMTKLLPLAYGFLILVVGLTVLLVAADLVNPVTIS